MDEYILTEQKIRGVYKALVRGDMNGDLVEWLRGFDKNENQDFALEMCHLALKGLERDERAEKVGRAVLSALGNANVRDLRAWAQDLHEDSSGGWSHRGAIFDAIASALEAP